MSDIKLKPCPFCGGEAKLGTINGYWIECTECAMETEFFLDMQEIVELWNTRKPMDRIVEELEEAKEIVKEYEKYHYSVRLDKAIDIVKGGVE